ncbi:MAG: phosphate starvation-inducible protein [uncultured marine phage]|uniref:PhoH-like protein n=1 Tax=uncultured marine phage TaxID=707152 RepID=A0A8D9C9C3_9VIRU|nr:MAG: phosphate starvation-inducible protein [uncultured marine phage]
MSKYKTDLKNEIDQGIEDYKNKKRMSKRKSGINKSEFDKCGVQLTPKQDQLYKGIKNNTLTVIHGPAGTSKTFTACYTALGLLANKKINKIIITKPIQESGEQLGHLPGTIEEKTEPFMKSYISNFIKIIGPNNVEWLTSLEEISVEPLAYMRGSTYDDCIMLLDECQNASMKQLMLWSTRLGKNSKMVMMGDTSQFDVRKRDSGFTDFINMVDGMNELLSFQFKNEDIVRNKFLIELTNRYDIYRSDSESNNN